METKEDIRREIDEVKDRIRLARQGTPHRVVFEWYLEIDRLEEELARMEIEGEEFLSEKSE